MSNIRRIDKLRHVSKREYYVAIENDAYEDHLMVSGNAHENIISGEVGYLYPLEKSLMFIGVH